MRPFLELPPPPPPRDPPPPPPEPKRVIEIDL